MVAPHVVAPHEVAPHEVAPDRRARRPRCRRRLTAGRLCTKRLNHVNVDIGPQPSYTIVFGDWLQFAGDDVFNAGDDNTVGSNS
ncbi:hypothetical protein ACFWBB_36020 [Streptomyces sp. NPDC060000]|uniref:hypothetical protein n=1 Tax=Streptomyces sp. NPDC060000 TaxID=3347031 RepID=UPI00368B72F6